jgi:hypothetical protein
MGLCSQVYVFFSPKQQDLHTTISLQFESLQHFAAISSRIANSPIRAPYMPSSVPVRLVNATLLILAPTETKEMSFRGRFVPKESAFCHVTQIACAHSCRALSEVAKVFLDNW